MSHFGRHQYTRLDAGETEDYVQQKSEAGIADGFAEDGLEHSKKSKKKHWAWVVVHLIVATLNIWFLSYNLINYRKHSLHQLQRGLLSDAVFGHVPMKEVVWEKDEAFTSTDPWNGQYWNNGSAPKGRTPWDDLYRSGWIEVHHPASYDLSGGVPLAEFADEGYEWPADAEGYNVAVLHQIHCIGTLKHLIESKDYAAFGHAEHCIEYLRQSVLCQADLTLEPPASMGNGRIKGTTGWGNVHYCRDWDVVHRAISERLIRFTYHDSVMKVIPDR